MKSALVVVSHYNAWPTDHLIHLLDQIAEVPAGFPFRCRVVVNQAEPKALVLPERHANVEVVYRPNTGYNIGAWDCGWRHDPAADYYLFLQEECQIVRPGWLRAFVRLLERPRMGLVGESSYWTGHSWRRADYYWRDVRLQRGRDGAEPVPVMTLIRDTLRARQIPPGRNVEHLQALVLATRRDVLEAIDGFVIGSGYGDAVGSEVAISKQVEALGLQVRQVGIRPFRYILHPQWRKLTTVGNMVYRWFEGHLPIPLGARIYVFPLFIFPHLHHRTIGRVGQALVNRLKPTPRT